MKSPNWRRARHLPRPALLAILADLDPIELALTLHDLTPEERDQFVADLSDSQLVFLVASRWDNLELHGLEDELGADPEGPAPA